jgi:hypothetical protein
MRPCYFSRIWPLLAGFLMLTPGIFAQVDITVRLIDAGSGKPIKKFWIRVDALDENDNKGRQLPPTGSSCPIIPMYIPSTTGNLLFPTD